MSAKRGPCPDPNCTKGSRDKAAVFTELDSGILWYCHRCESNGWDGDVVHGKRDRIADTRRKIGDGLSDYFSDLWRDCRPITDDCIAGQYLCARACTMPPEGSNVRWHPRVKHTPSGYEGAALVALISCAKTNAPMSIHRTWIKPDGHKASVEPAKMYAHGYPIAGGVIRIYPDDTVNTGLALAEGLETALSVAHVHTPVWATGDAGNLKRFPVLDGIECLTIYADNDASGTGLDAAHACAERWFHAGTEVYVVTPPAVGTDWCDVAAA
jgi:putative DNA primase/helicase